jgi:REP element-mobilizing transposase RayT
VFNYAAKLTVAADASIGIYEIRVHASVLMSNHFHLIVETQKANLSSRDEAERS